MPGHYGPSGPASKRKKMKVRGASRPNTKKKKLVRRASQKNQK